MDLYKVEAQVIRESVANRMFKRFRGAPWYADRSQIGLASHHLQTELPQT